MAPHGAGRALPWPPPAAGAAGDHQRPQHGCLALFPTFSQRVSASTGPALEGYWSHWIIASLVAQMVKNLPEMQETRVQSLRWEDLLEKGKATHCRVLAGESRGQSLAGYSPWGHKGSDD